MPYRHQVAALPIRRLDTGALEVLLVTTRETRRWVIPKGWPWEGRGDDEAAAREAWEEAGVRGEVRPSKIGRYAYLKVASGADRVLDVDVYLLDVVEVAADWPEARERERAWFSPPAAAEAVQEPGLKLLLNSLEDVASHPAPPLSSS